MIPPNFYTLGRCRRFLLGCGYLLAPLAFAQTDQSIFTDSLLNGWQNWSWATVNTANASPVHGGSRSISVSGGGWQALYLHHDPFASAGYSELVFWINGGATGGQRLQVQALRNGTAQSAVALGPLAPNTWQQMRISLTSLGVGNVSDFDGVWIQDTSGANFPAFYVDDASLAAVAAPSAVQINVNAATVLRTVDARHFGLNAAVWDSSFATTTTSNLLVEMGNQTMRYPGGSLSDDYHWQSNTSGNNTWTWATGFNQFAPIAAGTSAKVFITVNYGSGTPTEAANWVREANVTRGYGFKYWEVGNENYGSWETDTTARPHDPYTYANRFKDYWTQMKAVDPSIKLGAVVVTGEDSYANYTDHPITNPRTGQIHNGWTPVLLATLKGLGVTPDFVIYHRYAQGPGGENDAGLLQSSGTWGSDAADLRQQLTDYLGAAGANVELTCTENNSVYSNPGKQTTSLVNGLFLADSLCSAMKTEFNALVWWDLRNGQETGNNNSSSLYGWRQFGDYGIVDSAVPAGPADRYPTFYVAKLLKNFARGGDQLVAATSDYIWLAAYAARRVDGALTLLVLNKSASSTYTGNISIAGYTPGANASVYSYGIAQDEAARTGSGSADIAMSSFGGASASFSYTFTPYSATVLVFGGTPPPPPTRLPDCQVRASNDSLYLGDNLYNSTGAGQTRSLNVKPNKSVTYHLLVQNDGNATDSFKIRGSAASASFTVKYYDALSGGSDISAAMTSGTYAVNNLAVGGTKALRVVVTAARGAAVNAVQTCLVTATSTADTSKSDTVATVTTVN